MNHKIRINQISAGRYCVTGAATITDSAAPIADAALAIRAAGYPDTDTLAVICGEVTVIPATIGKILAPRPHPPKALSALTNGVGPTNP